MELIEMMRVAIDEIVGNRGAIRNCRRELTRAAEDEAKVERLSRRLPAVRGAREHATVSA